jgi:hypothetical protein
MNEEILMRKFNKLADALSENHKTKQPFSERSLAHWAEEQIINKEIHKTLRQIKKIRRGK